MCGKWKRVKGDGEKKRSGREKRKSVRKEKEKERKGKRREKERKEKGKERGRKGEGEKGIAAEKRKQAGSFDSNTRFGSEGPGLNARKGTRV